MPPEIFLQLTQDDRGATAVEYGLILALIVIAILSALGTLGAATLDLWGNIASEVINATT